MARCEQVKQGTCGEVARLRFSMRASLDSFKYIPAPQSMQEEYRIAELEYAKLEAFYRAEWGLGPGETL